MAARTEPAALARRFIVEYKKGERELYRGGNLSSADPRIPGIAGPLLEMFETLPVEAQVEALGSGVHGIMFDDYMGHLHPIEPAAALACLSAFDRGLKTRYVAGDKFKEPPGWVYEKLSRAFRRVLARCRDRADYRDVAAAYSRIFRDVHGSKAAEFAAASPDPRDEFLRSWKEAAASKSYLTSTDGILVKKGSRYGADFFVYYVALNLYRAVYDTFGDGSSDAARRLLELAGRATSAAPTARWIADLQALRAALPADRVRALAGRILDEFLAEHDFPAEKGNLLMDVERAARDLARGLLWAVGPFVDDALIDRLAETVREHSKLGDSGGMYAPYAIRAIVLSGHARAVNLLQHLRREVSHKNVRKALDRALADLAGQEGVGVEALLDASADTHGLDSKSQRSWTVGKYRLVLTVGVSGGARLSVFDARARKELAEAPAELVKSPEWAAVGAVRGALVRDVRLQKSRLEEAMIQRRRWTRGEWETSVARHPVVLPLARRLLWRLEEGRKASLGLFQANPGRVVWLGVDGREFAPGADTTLSVPHPVELGLSLMRRWQARLVEERIAQPFKQLFRETYVPTPAELELKTYSTRFAAHIVPHRQMYALLKQRGWTGFGGFGYDGAGEGYRDFRRHGLRAEMVRDQPDDGARGLVTLDRVSFSGPPGKAPRLTSMPEWKAGKALEAHHRRRELTRRPTVPLADVDPIVFSETMRDIDLVVSVGSYGTDRFWQDWEKRRARGDVEWGEERARYDHVLDASAATRRRLLEEVLPGLGLSGRVRFEGSYARVQGKRRAYRVHLGCGSVHLEPEGRYVCIVADISDPLPVWALGEEEDPTTLLILSKVRLLANDDAIGDPSIRRQLE